ncbi:MAG: META domain-containing protein [Robiginitomaculum sp.]|nr:META domain-containing protein [Robiginitomaculum sp.]
MWPKKSILALLAYCSFGACAHPIADNVNMPLAGSEWGARVKGQYIQFTEGGIVRGHGACNRFSGTYNQDGNRLTIGPLASTKMACAHLSQEQEFFRILAQTRQAEISHQQLVLINQHGDTLLTLQRRDWD